MKLSKPGIQKIANCIGQYNFHGRGYLPVSEIGEAGV
jgi:hypothetical protein